LAEIVVLHSAEPVYLQDLLYSLLAWLKGEREDIQLSFCCNVSNHAVFKSADSS
jgi:hypothetical protein